MFRPCEIIFKNKIQYIITTKDSLKKGDKFINKTDDSIEINIVSKNKHNRGIIDTNGGVHKESNCSKIIVSNIEGVSDNTNGVIHVSWFNIGIENKPNRNYFIEYYVDEKNPVYNEFGKMFPYKIKETNGKVNIIEDNKLTKIDVINKLNELSRSSAYEVDYLIKYINESM